MSTPTKQYRKGFCKLQAYSSTAFADCFRAIYKHLVCQHANHATIAAYPDFDWSIQKIDCVLRREEHRLLYSKVWSNISSWAQSIESFIFLNNSVLYLPATYFGATWNSLFMKFHRSFYLLSIDRMISLKICDIWTTSFNKWSERDSGYPNTYSVVQKCGIKFILYYIGFLIEYVF